MGLAMGATLIALVYSPWGQRSGAHMNPATTLAFWRLGRVAGWDALGYIAAQFVGGTAGLALAALALGRRLADPPVDYVTTVPGPWGVLAAIVAEASISFVVMLSVLAFSNSRRLNRLTGLVAATLLATFIALESPLSGTSMNPARTAASSVFAGRWTAYWVYATVPPLAMLAAAGAFVAIRGRRSVFCAKYHHENDERCIFRCRYAEMAGERETGRARGASTTGATS
jgi:aquaporin Z